MKSLNVQIQAQTQTQTQTQTQIQDSNSNASKNLLAQNYIVCFVKNYIAFRFLLAKLI